MTGPEIRVLFEDGDYLAVDKPEGVVSIAHGGLGGLPELLRGRTGARLYPVHRLDRDASGVIVLAKNADAHRHLNREFDRRAVRKAYLALVHGSPEASRGTVRKPIREFGSGRMGVDPERGKPSMTEFEVVERFGRFTLVRAHPLTGRRHQVRVHMYSLGHPIAGDTKYGDRAAQSGFPRLMLHALEISFGRQSGETLTVRCPPPESFSRVLENVRRTI